MPNFVTCSTGDVYYIHFPVLIVERDFGFVVRCLRFLQEDFLLLYFGLLCWPFLFLSVLRCCCALLTAFSLTVG